MRVFVLGMGAQKAATSWLFRSLMQSKKYRGGLTKEYHLFDVMELGSSSADDNAIERRLRNYPFFEESSYDSNFKTMKSFYADPQNYYDFFDGILKGTDSFTSDITPLYAGLSKQTLECIRGEFSRRGIKVRVVFIMREPILRAESMVKMVFRREQGLHGVTRVEMLAMLKEMLNSSENQIRSDYAATVERIDCVFEPEDIFYGFYETLFSPSEIKRLSEFLNISPEVFDTRVFVNHSNKSFTYKRNDVEALKGKVQDRYQFVERRFGFDTSIWNDVLEKLVEPDSVCIFSRLFKKRCA